MSWQPSHLRFIFGLLILKGKLFQLLKERKISYSAKINSHKELSTNLQSLLLNQPKYKITQDILSTFGLSITYPRALKLI